MARFMCIVVLLMTVLSMTGNFAEAQENPDLMGQKIVINIAARKLEFYSGGGLVKEYSIAVGKASTPTPLGDYQVVYKEVNPAWYPPNSGGKVVPSGPYNPLGYRWMGLFGNYGIHGTNAPASIGHAVSNGCIRMQEESVEELFEVIKIGTPVKIEYERVRIRSDNRGNVSVAVYPDIYGYGPVVTAEGIRQRLIYNGFYGLADDKLLKAVAENAEEKFIYLGRKVSLEVNGKNIGQSAVFDGERMYVPVWVVAGALNSTIDWNANTQVVKFGERSVPGVVRGDVIYVTRENALMLFGGVQSYDQENNTYFVQTLQTLVHNKPAPIDAVLLDEKPLIPALPLAKALDVKLAWQSDNQKLLYQDSEMAYVMVGGMPYLKAETIDEYFGIQTHYDSKTKRIKMSYPDIAGIKRNSKIS